MSLVPAEPSSTAATGGGPVPTRPQLASGDDLPAPGRGRNQHRRQRQQRRTQRAPDFAPGGGSDAEQGPGQRDHGDPEALARALCLRQLDARARTRAELAAYLARKGVPPEPAERVLDRFAQVGLIDDRALAESFVDSRHRDAGLGRRALTQKLRRRGVQDQVIESAVSVVDAESELATARDLVGRKLRSVSALDPQVQARRLVGMLARKGYPPGLAYRVVRESLTAAELPIGMDD